MSYDVGIVGCGTAGIFAAYELLQNHPGIKIVILEKGHDIYKRKCPMIAHAGTPCANCRTCDIMRGFGGAGAFSDGKYNFTTQFGGWLNDYISDEQVMELIQYVDSINMKFGATDELFSTYSQEAHQLEQRALEHDLHLLQASVKHLGTENNLEILKKMYEWINERVDLFCETEVTKITQKTSQYSITTKDGRDFEAQYVIVAPGRAGAEWFSDQCRKMGLSLINNQVDIGVRVEVPAAVMEPLTKVVYEAKLLYRTKQYGDMVRTFCMNPYGQVVAENVDGIITVNGHSYSDPALHSQNTNFALLVSNRFTEPFREPYQYGKRIASLSNMLGGGVIVQRFGDLLQGIRTNEHRLTQSFVKPTLSCTAGDLSLVLTKRHMDNIIEMIQALNTIAPGVANYDTLLYGVEVKFYSARLQLTEELETEKENLFAAGDGAGITRGLSQAGASGVLAARSVLRRMN